MPLKVLYRRRSRSPATPRSAIVDWADRPGRHCCCRRRRSSVTPPRRQGWPSWPRRFRGLAHHAAAAHAAALAAGDGAGLVDASGQYEAFGDRIAAADAAAQAVVAYQHAGLRGAALSAAAKAQRLAAECQGAQTPALIAATTAQPFTTRQREIISLAAQGLSNQEIADRLCVSIRSVEGHLFRASQRVGANNREQLISIMRGS